MLMRVRGKAHQGAPELDLGRDGVGSWVGDGKCTVFTDVDSDVCFIS